MKVLVTGASSGIGLATASLFARNQATVCISGRNVEKLRELESLLGAQSVSGDLTKSGECERVVRQAESKMGGLTTLINCVGVQRGGAFGTPECNLENFLYNFQGNTQPVFETMNAAVPFLIEAGREANPSIVNISSVGGMPQSFPGVPNYCASKAAIDQLSKCAAVDLAQFGIRVNCVNPGVILTELHTRGGMAADVYDAFLERQKQTHPIGRVGTPEEVAELIYFLTSDKATFITGESILIDGGRAALGAR